jgi:hypothetical protein
MLAASAQFERRRDGMDRRNEVQQSRNAVTGARSGHLRRWAAALVVAVAGSVLASVAPGARAVQGELVERVGHIDENGTEVVSAESPDGTRLYVGTAQGQVKVYQRNGNTWGPESIGLATVTADVRLGINDIVATNTHFYVATFQGVSAFSREIGSAFAPIRTGCVLDRQVEPGCTKTDYQMGHVYSLAFDAATSTMYAGGSSAVTALRAGAGGTLEFSGCVMEQGVRKDPCTGVSGLFVVQGLALNGTGQALFAGAERALFVLRPPIHGGGRFQFVQCFASRKTTSDRLEGQSGCTTTPGLSFVSDIAVGAVDPGGRFDPVYVTAAFSDALSHYYFDRSTGKLGFYECHRDVQAALNGCAHGVSFIAAPSSVAMSPDKRFVYVTGRDSFSLTPFFPEPGQPWGALIQHGCLADVAQAASGCIKQIGLILPRHVSISPAGTFVYVAADVLSIFRLDNTRSACGAACEQAPVPSDVGQADPGPGDPTPDGPDTTAPETTIDSAPKPKTRKSDSTFTFSSSEPGSTFECSFDGDDFDACTSPHTVTNIAKGKHSFQVVAIDAAGNRDETPARVDYKIKAKRR